MARVDAGNGQCEWCLHPPRPTGRDPGQRLQAERRQGRHKVSPGPAPLVSESKGTKVNSVIKNGEGHAAKRKELR